MPAAAKGFTITHLSGKKLPSLPFLRMKNAVLGSRYCLSFVVAGDALTKKLNKGYRGKTYVPNVLSFPIDPCTGEIFLNLGQARREHESRGESLRYYVALLFVHALFHLKGYRHGGTMEKKEQQLLSRFSVRNTLEKARS